MPTKRDTNACPICLGKGKSVCRVHGDQPREVGEDQRPVEQGTIDYQITAGLRFRKQDAPFLWRLAAHHWPTDTEGDVSKFGEAAHAAEKGTVMVVQVMSREELDEIVNWFPKHGVFPPRVEDVLRGHRPKKPRGKLIVVEK